MMYRLRKAKPLHKYKRSIFEIGQDLMRFISSTDHHRVGLSRNPHGGGRPGYAAQHAVSVIGSHAGRACRVVPILC